MLPVPCCGGCGSLTEQLRGCCPRGTAKGLACRRFTALPERACSEGVPCAEPPWPGELLSLRAAAAAMPVLATAAPHRAGVFVWPAPMPSSLRMHVISMRAGIVCCLLAPAHFCIMKLDWPHT